MKTHCPVVAALPCLVLAACSGGASSPLRLLAPAAPTQLGISILGVNTVELTWTDSTNLETGFRIERGPDPFTIIADLAANATSYTDVTPPRRTPWEYRLRSFNTVGLSDFSNTVVFKSEDPPAPVVTRFHPTTAFEAGMGELTFSGQGFLNFEAGQNGVTLGGVPALSVEVLDDQTILVRPPQGMLGTVDVLLTNLNGTFLPVQQFAYIEWPPMWRGAERRIDTDAAGATESDLVELAVDGDRVYAAWTDERSGSFDIYFNRSLDGGLTWLTTDRRLDSDATGADSEDLSLCASGENVYVVWHDARNGSGDIFFNRSLDGGSTWLPEELRIDTRDFGLLGSTVPKIACSGDNVYIAWQERLEFFSFVIDDVYVNRSTDAGTTWLSEEIRLDGGFGRSEGVRISASRDVVAVVWQDDRDGFPDINTNSSLDNGLTWQAAPVRVNSSAPGTTTSITPTIAVSGTNVHVAWEDDIDVGLDIYASRSLDGGLTWSPLSLRVNTNTSGSSNSQNPKIAAEKGSVYVVWEDTRGIREPRLNRSLDAGLTWLDEDVLVSPDAIAFDVQIAASGGNVYVAWEDSRAGQRDIFLSSSFDEGLTFQPMDLRVNSDLPGSSGSRNPRVSASGARAYIAWADFRNGKQDIYFRDTTDPLRP